MDHDRLWAPWRLAYVKGELPELRDTSPEPAKWLPDSDMECFVCRVTARQSDPATDRQNLLIARGQKVVTLLNRFPYSNGHLLVSPQRHVGELHELTSDEHLEIFETLTHIVDLQRRTIRPQGFNIGLNLEKVGGAGLPGHLHWHVVPRWAGDHNFMSTTAGTRVIPQSLEAAWELFTEAWNEKGT